MSWRQTGGCDPKGAREPSFDKPCTDPVPEGASGYCECTDGSHVAEQNCDHGTFSCIDECKGITHKQEEVLLTDYDMGRRDQRRSVDKLHRCVNSAAPRCQRCCSRWLLPSSPRAVSAAPLASG